MRLSRAPSQNGLFGEPDYLDAAVRSLLDRQAEVDRGGGLPASDHPRSSVFKLSRGVPEAKLPDGPPTFEATHVGLVTPSAREPAGLHRRSDPQRLALLDLCHGLANELLMDPLKSAKFPPDYAYFSKKAE